MKNKNKRGPKHVEGGNRQRYQFSLNSFESAQVDTALRELKTVSQKKRND